MAADGVDRKQIASRLAMAESTLKTHVADMFERMEARNMAHAVAIGMRKSLII